MRMDSNNIIENSWDLKNFKKQTYEICLKAVEQNGLLLKDIKWDELNLTSEQFYELCFSAVLQNGKALKYVKLDEFSKKQLNRICLMAVRQNERVLAYVKDQTPKMCIETLRQNKHAIRYIKDKEKYLDIFKIKYLKKQGDIKEIIAIKEKGEWLFSIGDYKNITKQELFNLKKGVNIHSQAYIDFLKDIENNKRTLPIKSIPKKVYLYYFLYKFNNPIIIFFYIITLLSPAIVILFGFLPIAIGFILLIIFNLITFNIFE
ncbi:hypothetical protein [Clostridioides sp. ZZV14-6045]|uniref:hypothetical protein n=1 Tax=Clostridioides sp. ZZV14-6045 TaxID=2811489 RepID=UPI001D11F38C